MAIASTTLSKTQSWVLAIFYSLLLLGAATLVKITNML